jgi:tetratricopeptide (TPR) repeat protein
LPLPEALLEAIASESSWKTTLAILSDYGVGSADGELLNLSPLIQAFLRDQLGDAGRRSWAEIAAHVVGAAYTFDPGRPETWDVAERMLGHALVVAAFAQTFEVALGPAGRLLNQAGLALARLGLWRPAKEIFLQALVVAERVYGSEHLTSAMAASNVSLALQQVGDPVEARRYGDRALQITEAFYGQAHPAVAGSLMNLATIYEAVGASEAAWEHLSRARSILERVRDQQGLLALLQRLANLAGQSDDLERLVTTLEASFRLQEQIGDHAAQAGILGQLGLALARRGQPELAVERFQKALQLYQALGDRANEAFILNQTGVLISMQGNVVHGLSLTVLSYLLYESLGRPEAEIAYQNIARQVAQAKLGVDQVVSVLRQATEIYRNNRYDPRIAAPLTVPVAAPAQPAEAIDQLVSEPEPKRESTHLPEAVTGTEVPVASVETLSTVGESVLILEESSKDRANGSSPRLDGETSRAPAKLYQDDRELMALARRIARRLDGMTDIDKSIQLRWQTYFQDAQRILKISCDDGIFTDALHAAGLTVEELEVEPRLFDAGHGDSQVSITRAQEHLVNYAESYDGIFLPYVVEYLDGTALLRLLRDCRNALRSTGTVLILTPNFRNADVASEVFWLDLARQRPYPPRLLNEILIELGLDIWEQSYVADGHVVCLAARLPATIPKGERDLVGEH